MSTPHSVSVAAPPPAAALPGALARWAAERPRAIALRHKSRGVWVAWTWRDVEAEVVGVASALTGAGFQRGDVVAVGAGLSPQALAVTLAAQRLGGAAIWVDIAAVGPPAGQASHRAAALVATPGGADLRFGFAEDEGALAELRAKLGVAQPWALALVTAEHAAPWTGAASDVRAYADLAAEGSSKAPAGAPQAGPNAPAEASSVQPGSSERSAVSSEGAGRQEGAAFIFSEDGGDRALPSLGHAASVAGARAWLEADGIGARAQAFAWEGPTTRSTAVFFAAWLVAGFTWIVPEDATTADADRREVQPTLMAATGAAYGRLWQRVADDLPSPGTVLRRAVDAGLAARTGLPRAAGWWLVRRPLRTVLGLRRVGVALVLGETPASIEAQDLLASLGLRLRTLPAVTARDLALPATRATPDQAALFEPALALSSTPGTIPGTIEGELA